MPDEITLAVGQVWWNEKGERRIVWISEAGYMLRYRPTIERPAITAKTFRAWIRRTGAKLEGSENG